MLVVIVACGIGAYTWNAQRGDVYRAVAGERRLITLEDGSKISLDARSEVRVRYSKDARRLELLGGQARFDVAHDSRRPFSVRARDQLVIATGTAFNIDMVGSTVLVTLIEGRVEVLEDIGMPHGAVPLKDRKSTSLELQSLMRISYAVFCLKKKHQAKHHINNIHTR